MSSEKCTREAQSASTTRAPPRTATTTAAPTTRTVPAALSPPCCGAPEFVALCTGARLVAELMSLRMPPPIELSSSSSDPVKVAEAKPDVADAKADVRDAAPMLDVEEPMRDEADESAPRALAQ